MPNTTDRLELLSPSLIDQFPETVREIDLLCRRLHMEIGWHYILDITWILEQLDAQLYGTILDAGAGLGALQFVLAQRGCNIISVDFSRRSIPFMAAMMFPIEDMGGREFQHSYIDHLQTLIAKRKKRNVLSKAAGRLRRLNEQAPLVPVMWVGRLMGIRKPGKVSFYGADMSMMDMIADKSVDAVVSVSAIEHMERETIALAVKEFERVLKPGGKVVVTTSAAAEKDWFHEPSKGWCFSESTLKELFRLGDDAESNWALYNRIMDDIKASQELQRRIPSFYRLSGDNGMPWGIWDPQYLPVGIVKTVSG